jgi:hypothetical protein
LLLQNDQTGCYHVRANRVSSMGANTDGEIQPIKLSNLDIDQLSELG